MFGGFIINGYQAAIPALAPLANLTWFGWTSNHIPLAGQFDWVSLVPVAIVAIVLFVVGVEAFARRDIGATSPIPTPSLPRALVGLRGPTGRAIGQNLPSSIAWGIGIGIFGLAIAGSGRSFIEELGKATDFVQAAQHRLPGLRHPVGRRVPPAAVRRVRDDPRRPRGRDARRDLGVRRDLRAARVPAGDAALAGPLGRRPAASR